MVDMHWILWFASLFLASPTLAQSPGTPQKLTIQGSVLDSSEEPLEGATVFVYTAAPRVGTASL